MATFDIAAGFWEELAHALDQEPTSDGVTRVFARYGYLGGYIDARADKNPDHREMLDRAIAIRDGDERAIIRLYEARKKKATGPG